ncbi:MAG: class I SAM-dependent methyltransferase, partial [Gammaproteobacteria bacterium]|nr:class I SAM-dependent methyltransferase [Gammaproteobacteria bacterium]
MALSDWTPHALLPRLRHDEAARQDFVFALRGHLSRHVMPGVYRRYERRAEPRFRREHGRPPRDAREVRELLERDDYYRFWSALQRRSQELLWEAVIDPTERELPRLVARARATRRARGSLRLNPKLAVPRYQTAADIHLQPGGYHTEFVAGDVSAGALYDRALYLYSLGALGPENGALGELLLQYYRDRYPNAMPRRLLDMGCGIGNSLLPWARAFPRCEAHGIDIGAPMLRYAHARAAALGAALHFSQQNAEQTDFPSGSFDLVVSHLLLHETSRSALPRILAECHRLLRPGGVMLHLEVPRGVTPVEKFIYNWEVYNNNETFGQFLTDW